ncbi:MAG TPA: DUF6508 domain-containing protein [Bacteroidales bacterium]|nr:DUF6508 domain-containing protein [Bacteroidales bacterium]
MIQPSKQIENILSESNEYDCDINLYCAVLSYIPYFKDIKEDDYIKYHKDHSFEYSPEFYSFIKALNDAKLVEDEEKMASFLKSYNLHCGYNKWIKDMNIVLENEELLGRANISLLKKVMFSLIRLERVCPGSWGIDAESGNWLKILNQLKRILSEIYKENKSNAN